MGESSSTPIATTIGTRKKKPTASSLKTNSLLKSSGASTMPTSLNGSKTLQMANSATSGWTTRNSTRNSTCLANWTTTNAGKSITPNGTTRTSKTRRTCLANGTTTNAGKTLQMANLTTTGTCPTVT